MEREIRDELRALRGMVERLAHRGTPLEVPLTRREAAEALRIKVRTLKTWIAKGRIQTCEDRRAIPRSEVERLAGPKPESEPKFRGVERRPKAAAKADAEKIRAALKRRR